MRHFAIYPDTFDGNTLGYWRFGERAGDLAGEIAGQPALTNYGAQRGEDGYRFVTGQSDYLQASYPAQPARAQLTLEGWVRDYQTATGLYGAVVTYALAADDSKQLTILCHRNATPANSYICTRLRVDGGGNVGDATWYGADADAVLASKAPWHVAGVLNAPASLKLFVDGVERASDTTGIVAQAAGDSIVWVGRYRLSYSFFPSCVIDEVRVSAAVRYAADFAVHRFGQSRRAVRGSWGEPLGLAAGLVT
jgi:hypothetical protein